MQVGSVGVWLEPALGLNARVARSSGVVRAGDCTRLRYGDCAWIPREPWHECEVERESETFVGVLRLPESATSRIRFLAERDVHARVAAIEVFQAALLERFACDGEIACDGMESNPPGLPTVTLDHDRFALLGLHVDQWDFRPLNDRARSRWRVAINVGDFARWFLFVPRTFESLAADSDPNRDPNVVARELLASSQEIEVVRVRIDPGEAYIAPTENLIHDASSLGNRTPCRNLVFRGHFRLRQNVVPAEKIA